MRVLINKNGNKDIDIYVGDYVRTINGIAKVTDIICGQDVKFDNLNIFDGDEDLLRHHNYDGISVNDYYFWNSYVIGNPTNDIMDLIEVGDYVNGRRVKAINCKLEYLDEDMPETVYNGLELDFDGTNNSWIYFDYEIEDIVTKEEFDSRRYKYNR
jgi:hypothetical protein